MSLARDRVDAVCQDADAHAEVAAGGPASRQWAPGMTTSPRPRSLDVRAARAGIVHAAAVHHRPRTVDELAARFTSWCPRIFAQAIHDAQGARLLTVGPDGALDVDGADA